MFDITLKSDEFKKIEVLRNSDNSTDCMKFLQDVYKQFEDEFSDEKLFPMDVFYN